MPEIKENGLLSLGQEEGSGNMRKRKNRDTLVKAIEQALDFGEFVSYNASWDFINC